MVKDKPLIKKAVKLNKLAVKREERSSHFVVDLKKISDNEVLDKSSVAPKKDWLAYAEEMDLENLSKTLRIFKESSLYFLKNFWRSKEMIMKSAETLLESSKLPPETKTSLVISSKIALSWYDIYKKELEQLAFLSLGKAVLGFAVKLGKRFYHLCYGCGWFFIFITRFVFLVIEKLVKYFAKGGSVLFLRLKVFFGKISQEARIKPKLFLSQLSQSLAKKELIKERFRENSRLEEVQEALAMARFSWKKSVLAFSLVLFVIVSPFKIFAYYKSLNLENLKGKILGASEAAVGDLTAASESAINLDFNAAEYNFSKAGGSFFEARERLSEINDTLLSLASLLPQKEAKLAGESKKILAAGQIASELGGNLSLTLASLFSKQENVPEMLDNFTLHGKIASAQALELNNQLADINPEVLPAEYKDKFFSLKEKSAILANGLEVFVDMADKLRIFLGASQDKRYLLIFQNNTEMRASGGFIGSFALIDFKDGKISNIETPGGGSYDTEGGLRELVVAPEPLSLVNPLWHFWDANWWPDWPTSAKKLMWFYEKSDGPTVDGVISFTPTVMEKLLEITGPIDLNDDYGVTINAENFWLVTQTIVEKKPQAGEENKPKKIIGDLMNKILAKLPEDLNKEKVIKLLSLVEESLNEKHVLFYFTDDELQKEAASRGWDGSIRQTKHDYLSVVNTNIAGGKSDKKIEETISHTAELMPNGSIIDTVKIVRNHTAINREPFCGVRNVNWIRVYVPEGSELLEASGFRTPDEIYFSDPEAGWKNDPLVYQEESSSKIDEASGTRIYNEAGKTVFANWSMVDPGQVAVIYLKYRLPFILESQKTDDSLAGRLKSLASMGQKELYPYALLAQKQAGSLGSIIKTELKLPENFKTVWKYPSDLSLIEDGWSIEDKLLTDKYWAVLMEKGD